MKGRKKMALAKEEDIHNGRKVSDIKLWGCGRRSLCPGTWLSWGREFPDKVLKEAPGFFFLLIFKHKRKETKSRSIV